MYIHLCKMNNFSGILKTSSAFVRTKESVAEMEIMTEGEWEVGNHYNFSVLFNHSRQFTD